MKDLKTINSLITDIWKLIKANPNPETEADWMRLLDRGKEIVNDPKYKGVESLAIHWINNYVFWLEGKI